MYGTGGFLVLGYTVSRDGKQILIDLLEFSLRPLRLCGKNKRKPVNRRGAESAEVRRDVVQLGDHFAPANQITSRMHIRPSQ